MTQGSLDFSAQAPRPEPHRPGSEHREVIRAEVRAALAVFALGRARAVTGERLAELVGLRLQERGHDHGLKLRSLMRAVQVAVGELIDEGEPVGSSSARPLGYWWAETAEELEESLAEVEKRARMTLRRRRAQRAALARLRGQVSMRGVA